MNRFSHYSDEDIRLDGMLPYAGPFAAFDLSSLRRSDAVRTYDVHVPTDDYAFLHEAAVIEYHGVLFASWYNNPRFELNGRTPIRERRSADGGRTWSDVKVIADDPSGKILYCPPVYGICDDTLYLLMNEMVSADHIHALDLYVYNETTDAFEMLWSRPIPFKLNTNVTVLPNGKLMLSGRVAELDGFPNTPAVLISDSGKIDAEWRLVYIRPDGCLPDGSKLVHPEISPVLCGGRIYMFCRDDERNVPLVYLSGDNGESWTGPYTHDIPFSSSKIYSGTMPDGRSYLIGNLYPSRTKLVCLFADPGTVRFTSGVILQDGPADGLGAPYGQAWHYPVACISGSDLCVIYTASEIGTNRRGAVLSRIPEIFISSGCK